MTSNEFNLKYKDYIEDRFEGLEIDIPELTNWLDDKFQEFIKIPGFQFAQIKSKFGYGRFYANGLSSEQLDEVKSKITNYCR
ncbi:MAG: hypothetical protein EOL97_08550 [Spirochaetia bacterium]|nr:hypothetical protein [Spirochaetia bacterium]